MLNLKSATVQSCLFYFLISLVIYSQGLSLHGIEYRDDEVFYFNSAHEMVETGDYLSPKYFGENRFQKPILFYWFIVASFKIFGVNWFAARFVSVVFAGMTVALTWLIAKQLFQNNKFAHLSALILMSSPLFFRHAKNVVPDMALTFFIVWACYCIFHVLRQWQDSHQVNDRLVIGIFTAMALGFMVKGLAAVFIPAFLLIINALSYKQLDIFRRWSWVKGLGVFLLICAPWFIYMIIRHGTDYMDYMVSFETRDRILGVEQQGGFLTARLIQFGKNALFYLQTLFQYFAPWSLFLIFALPIAVKRILNNHQHKNILTFFVSWMGIVFVMFSFMDFKISHYMLSLAVPYVLLLSYFCFEAFSKKRGIELVLARIRENYLLLMLILCGLFYMFFTVYILQWNPWVLVLIISAIVYCAVLIKIKRDPGLPVFILGGVILFILMQAPLLSKAGLTPHNTLKTMAEQVHALKRPEYAVGVGSHDLHEKEFQVYFDQRVEKLATNHEGYNIHHLSRMFNYSKDVFCLITEKDYNYYFSKKPLNEFNTVIVKQDYIARKRFHLDSQFWFALITMDQKKVYDYLMEKVVLIRKVNDA